jgi:hypothetical protein
MRGKQNGGEGRKKEYIYSSSCDLLLQLVLLVNQHKMTQSSSCKTIRQLLNGEPRNEILYVH